MTSDQKRVLLFTLALSALVLLFITGAALGFTREPGSASDGCAPLPLDLKAQQELRDDWFKPAAVTAAEVADCDLQTERPAQQANCTLHVAASSSLSRDLKLRARDAVHVRFVPRQDQAVPIEVDLEAGKASSFPTPKEGASVELACASPGGCRWPALQ